MTIDAKFHVSFYVDVERLPEILNSVLPVGVFDFKTEFVPLHALRPNANQLLALPPPTTDRTKIKAMKQKIPKASRGKGTPQGRAAQIIRRVLSHMPNHTATARDLTRAITKAGMHPSQNGTLQSLIEAGEITKAGWGKYSLARQ